MASVLLQKTSVIILVTFQLKSHDDYDTDNNRIINTNGTINDIDNNNIDNKTIMVIIASIIRI